MTYREHGIACGITRINKNFYMNIQIVGKLTHDDYEIMVPMLEKAIEGVNEPSVIALIDIRDFEGMELRAAWDDLKLGLKHGSDFSKIAVIGNKNWEKIGTKVANWFSSGEIHYFENKQEALEWCEN